MITTAYVLPSGPPADGDDIASGLGWLVWCNFVMARATSYPECAHLACFGWSDQFDALEEELHQIPHDPETDPDVTATSAQILAEVRARPAECVEFRASTGEPAEEDGVQQEAFDSSKHPRADDGEFASRGGGKGRGKKSTGAKSAPKEPHPTDGKTSDQIKTELGKLTFSAGGRDPNPWKIDPAKAQPATLNAVQDALGNVQKSIKGFERPKIADVFDEVKKTLPDLSLGEFQAALVRLEKDGRVELGQWTLAPAALDDRLVATAFPWRTETKVYVEPRALKKYESQENIFREDRHEGEIWQGQSGKWFTLKQGRVVPHTAPNQGGGSGNSEPPKTPTELPHEDRAALDADVERAIPEEARKAPGLVNAVKLLALKAAVKALEVVENWPHTVHVVSSALYKAADTLLDTKEDVSAKLGYNPLSSGVASSGGTNDAIRNALQDSVGVGIGGHLALKIASTLVTKLAFWGARKLRRESTEPAADGIGLWADLLAQLFAHLDEEFGVQGAPDADAVAEKLRALLGG